MTKNDIVRGQRYGHRAFEHDLRPVYLGIEDREGNKNLVIIDHAEDQFNAIGRVVPDRDLCDRGFWDDFFPLD